MKKLISYALGLGLLLTAGTLPVRAAVYSLRMDPNRALTEPNITPVPETSTIIAGALLLLPFGLCALKTIRKARPNFTHPHRPEGNKS